MSRYTVLLVTLELSNTKITYNQLFQLQITLLIDADF